ncbi:hypothetical protein [Enterovirga rhinocerotis]|uniref:Uncharacterized protein n=1 Tax=Enterovirga rhinocerotis TaxID=1339210 RepID=A0A4R7BWQ7_9HYPH|nr:hypothetical protein [Enterovirga rhinocerotis]TDR90314.1 hypothetical protein EV668_3162 [Enterovirga rhinocerotis]
MGISEDKIADLRVKRLELLTGSIARMASYSASLKTFCMTVLTAVVGAALTLKAPLVLLVGFLPILGFALLDAQYLRMEKRFRGLYRSAASEPWSAVPDFTIDPSKGEPIGFWRTCCSWSILNFYGCIALLLALFFIVARRQFCG